VESLWVSSREGFPQMSRGKFISLVAILCCISPALPVWSEERSIGEGQHRGFIVHEGEQVLKIGSIKPGQTIQVQASPQWKVGKGGQVEWTLTDSNGAPLRAGSQVQPNEESLFLEWTSNSEPRPDAYRIQIQGKGGSFPGEILGQYIVQLSLWDQNDCDSGTDAPETYEKALELPAFEPGLHIFNECFLSGTADIYDLYKISLKPNHSLILKTVPVQWYGATRGGIVRWDFLNRSFKRMKDGQSSPSDTSPFLVRVFHPQVRSGSKPAIFYLLVKIEGEVSLVYSLQLEIQEGR